MSYKTFKLLVYKVLIISTALLYISCGNTKKQNRSEFVFPEDKTAAIRELEERSNRLQEHRREVELSSSQRQLKRIREKFQNFEAMKNNPCLDTPKLYKDPVNENNNLSLDTEALGLNIREIREPECRITVCRCAYFTGSPSQWKVKVGFNFFKRKSKEVLESILLQTCQSHNKSFKIHSCSKKY